MEEIDLIKIVAELVVKEENIDKFQKLAEEIVKKSRLEEGNISYSLNQSIQNPKVHTFIEIWKDEEAIETHNASEHFTRILPQLGDMSEEPAKIELYREIEY